MVHVEIRIYGGIGEIGGNKIVVSSNDGKAIILDFGKSFSPGNAFFQHPYMPPSLPEDYFKTGLLPPTEGPEWRLADRETLGLIISHAHLDHWGYLPLVHSDTKIWMGSASYDIIKAYRDLRSDLKRLDEFQVRTFRTGDQLSLGEFTILPIHVDHSIPGAYGFIVECCGRKLVYTGDIRMHGPKAEMTMEFIDKASSEDIDLLIMEATKVAPENDPESSLVRILENRIWYRWGKEPPKRVHFEVKTEEEVREKMLYVLERSSSLALVEISTADVDRLRTAFNVARSLGREPILDERTAFLSHRLGRSGIKGLPQVGSYRVWRRRRGKGGIEVKYGVREPKAIKEFLLGIEDKMGPESVVWGDARAEILKEPESYVVITNNATRFLYEIPLGIKPPITFIMSRSEPFSEESALSLDRLLNWLMMYDVRRYYRIHVSGHLSPEQIGEVIEAINPRKVMPIHTEHPDLFDVYVPSRMSNLIHLPRLGEPFRVGDN